MFGCIRVATPGDAGAIAEIYEPAVRGSATSFETTPPTVPEMQQRIERTMVTHPWLVFEADGVLGYAYGSEFADREAYRWSTTLSAYVREGFHRKGIGRALTEVLIDLLERQGYARALAGITLPNPASVGLFESLGFRQVGTFERVGLKLGAWRDVGWWQRSLGEPSHHPEPPVPFSALRTPEPSRS